MKVGTIGLGVMGGAIVARMLSNGLTVSGYDPAPERCDQVAALGGAIATSPAAVAAASDVVLLSLASEQAFDQVIAGEGGLVAAAVDGLVVVDTSTLSLAAKERGREALAAVGVTLLDCPISGTGDQARSGDVVVFASGDQQAVDYCVPVFEAFARSHYYLGEFGAGSKMKFVANLLVAVHNVAAAEALMLARAAGLDLEQTLAVIADSAAASRMWEVRGPKMIAGEYGPGIRLSVFEKDLAIITSFARANGAPTPLLEQTISLYDEAVAAGDGELDSAAVFRRYLKAAGEQE